MNAESSQVKKAPFRAVRDAYAGPQQLALAGGIKRALIAPDSIVTLSGPVGSGKTASVKHALSRIGHSVVVARIGRVSLQRDDVLEVLLDEFGVNQKPASALQRFSALKRLLTNWSEVGTDVFVVVEDGECLGAEALAELESLTATDDDTPGAHLILMGTDTLGQFLGHPALARLKQRVRRNLQLEPFSLNETRGYLSHCLSVAGNDLAEVFADDAVEIVHGCSGGVARVINNVAETMMIVAADTGSGQVTGALARNIAVEDFDFETKETVNAVAGSERFSRSVDDLPSDDPSETGGRTTASGDLLAGRAASAPASANDRTPPATARESLPVAEEADSDIPALIQDTFPPMPALSDTDLEAANQTVGAASSEPIAAEAKAHELIDELIPSRPADAGSPPVADNDAGKLKPDPRVPEPLSKSTDVADTQTMKALDSALRPDTQLLKSLEEPVEPVVDDAPVPLGLRKEIADDRPGSPVPGTASIPTLDAVPERTDDGLPTLSNSMRFDVADDGSSGAGAPSAESDTGAASTINPGSDRGAPGDGVTDAGIAKDPGVSPAILQSGKAPASRDEAPRMAAADSASSRGTTPAADSPRAAADRVAGTDPGGDLNSESLLVRPSPAAKAVGETDRSATPETVPSEPGPGDPNRTADAVSDEPGGVEQRSEVTAAATQAGGPAVAEVESHRSEASPESISQTRAAEANREAASLQLKESPENELPEISLVPEITLDRSLDDHQKAAQARLAEEAEKRAEEAEKRAEASAAADASANDSAARQAEKDASEEAERKQRLESLAERFGSAKSIEDVLDDTAAETLFGEEFSQIAAAVTAMHESESFESDTPDTKDGGSEPAADLSLDDAGDAGLEATATSTPDRVGGARERELTAKPASASHANGDAAGASAVPTTAKTPNPAAAKPSVPPAAASNTPGAAPRPPSPPKGDALDSSAAQRLEMVRALNEKAGKPMPPMPDSAGEEIVLGGSDSSPTCSGPKPERIENQFGLSMTATLKALSAENIKSMQEEEEQAEKKEKKKGLLSRFRRS